MCSHMQTNAFEKIRYHKKLGVELLECGPGRVKLHLPFREENANFGGALHGGIAGSLISIAALQLGADQNGGPPENGQATIVSMDVQYLSAAISEPIEAVGNVLRKGKELTFVGVDVFKQGGKPVARGSVVVRCVPEGEDKEVKEPQFFDRSSFYSGSCDPGPIAEIFQSQTFIKSLNLDLEHVKDSLAIVRMPLSDGLNGDLDGCFHEGSITALMDTTGALAAWSTVPLEMHKASTPSMHINFFKKAASQEVYALARVRWQKQELFLNDVHIVDVENGSMIADGTVVYRIVQKNSHN